MSQTRSGRGRCPYFQGEERPPDQFRRKKPTMGSSKPESKTAWAKRIHCCPAVCGHRHQHRYHVPADLQRLGDNDVSLRFNSPTMYDAVPRLRQLVQNEICFLCHDYT